MRLEILETAETMYKELSGEKVRDSGYLFPFLSGTREGREEYLEYNAALFRFNRNLKALKEFAGITSDVTSYTIRHSFAMTLKEQNVPIEMISELLGHKSIKTTQIYLRSFSLGKMTEVIAPALAVSIIMNLKRGEATWRVAYSFTAQM